MEEIVKRHKINNIIINGKKKRINEFFTQPVNCNKIFAKFLFQISDYLNSNWYKEIVLFICLFRKALNVIGWKFSNMQKADENEFCELNNAQTILECSNEFITICLPESLNDYEGLNLNFIGKDEEKIKNIIYFTNFFGKWLHINNYTTIMLKMNYEEHRNA